MGGSVGGWVGRWVDGRVRRSVGRWVRTSCGADPVGANPVVQYLRARARHAVPLCPPYPPYSRCQAELADPNAKPNKAALPAVDVCLRHVAHALLEGTADAAPAATADVGGGGSRPALASSLAYLRDRVGVPRDMGQAAAMHLRANLNWMIGQL